MSIQSLEFQDHEQPWSLDLGVLSKFNLLVGLSGVGKSRTLKVLSELGRIAQGKKSHMLVKCSWKLTVETTRGILVWTARTEPDEVTTSGRDDDDDERHSLTPRRGSRFVIEKVEDAAGTVIAERTEDSLTLHGSAIPRLRSSESIISLFDEEPLLSLRSSLRGIHYSKARTNAPPPLFDNRELNRLASGIETIADLRLLQRADLFTKAYLLQTRFPAEHDKVRQQFAEIFPTVRSLEIGPLSKFRPDQSGSPIDFLAPAFNEEGVDGWVDCFEMSNGMRWTLLHLLEMHLEPVGGTILIDEYENGMGPNCLPQVTDIILGRCCDIQLIFTSHHPYVINTVSKEYWRIMRRNGHKVEVLNPSSIPRLATSSHLDAFFQLINAPEFEEGIR